MGCFNTSQFLWYLTQTSPTLFVPNAAHLLNDSVLLGIVVCCKVHVFSLTPVIHWDAIQNLHCSATTLYTLQCIATHISE
uniref:Uncharacterized protein n=1 Tax=Pyxicephalus adspersus TaxID=30357 RepID=A0AAV3A8D4_PYXAD|nr:TPA: hypothetical protein GDO54_014305 [Pyxicephalus adspersus]